MLFPVSAIVHIKNTLVTLSIIKIPPNIIKQILIILVYDLVPLSITINLSSPNQLFDPSVFHGNLHLL